MNEQTVAPAKEHGHRTLLFLLFAGFVLSGVATTIVGPMLPVFIHRWSLDDGQAGLFSTIQFLAALGGTLASSALASWSGYRPALLAGYALMGGGLACLNAETHGVALAATAAFGLGYGLITPGTNLFVAELGGAKSASLLNQLNFAWGAGAMICSPFVAVALRRNKISTLLVGLAIFGGSLALGLLFTSFGGEERRKTAQTAESTTGPRIGMTITVALAALFFVYVAVENGIGIWAAEYAKRLAHGITGMTTLAPMFFRSACSAPCIRKKDCARRSQSGRSGNDVADRIQYDHERHRCGFSCRPRMRKCLPHLHCLALAVVRPARKTNRRYPFCAGLARRISGALAGGLCLKNLRQPARRTARAAFWHSHDDLSGAASAPRGRGLRYPLVVQTPSQRSPTTGLLFGLLITLAAVVAYSLYITSQLSGLRKLQSEMVDRNRRDSLQLLRVQNDLNSTGLAMRDMLDAGEPYPLTAWSAQFQRIREDLYAALRLEEQFAAANRTPEQQKYLSQSVAQFWDAVDRMFALASEGKDAQARDQIRLTLQARLQALSTAVSRLLVQNNEGEEQAAARIAQIYDGVQQQLVLFLGATLVAIVLTSLYLILANRRVFARLAALSEQRSDLAQKLIATQESTLRHISRELHDEFGQVLTAIGSLLGRAGNQVPEGSPLRGDLQEVREIAQSTLDNIRGLSQALHPVLLEEAGLNSTLDWYIPTVERQTGLVVHYDKSGSVIPVEGSAGVHIYRVLQEALNNVRRHSGAKEAWVRLKFLPGSLELEVEDHGKGIAAEKSQRGIGLVAMRERAELIGGTLEVLQPASGGTLIRLRMPMEKLDSHGG